MTPAARVQAAIELLDAVIAAAGDNGPAADTIITRYFKERRYAGSGDRRAVRDLVYRAVRRTGERPASGRAAVLGLAQDEPDLLTLFDGSAHAPQDPSPGEPRTLASTVPDWLLRRFDPLLGSGDLEGLAGRAPVDLRVNALKGTREAALAAMPDAVPTPLSPLGLRLPTDYRVEDHAAWKEGLVEVQDEGSQLIALACAPAPGELVVDLCAGAGGKTLALAAGMGNRGRVIASDSDRARLSRMPPRLERAGVSIVEQRLLNPGAELEGLQEFAGAADCVLVDAPCSGTGTWRRNPEGRWRITPERLDRVVALQSRLLDIAAALVRPGGRLAYAVCSLLEEEGRGQAELFLQRHSSFVSDALPSEWGESAGPGRLLSPARSGTDGFFVARWRRPC